MPRTTATRWCRRSCSGILPRSFSNIRGNLKKFMCAGMNFWLRYVQTQAAIYLVAWTWKIRCYSLESALKQDTLISVHVTLIFYSVFEAMFHTVSQNYASFRSRSFDGIYVIWMFWGVKQSVKQWKTPKKPIGLKNLHFSHFGVLKCFTWNTLQQNSGVCFTWNNGKRETLFGERCFTFSIIRRTMFNVKHLLCGVV